jgi:Zn-dependent protease with chaperone function
MWLTFIALVLVIAAVLASAFAGGAFTIVLIPLAVIAVGTATVLGLWSRASAVSAGETGGDAADPTANTVANALPRTRRRGGHAPSSPERLADARREQQ